MSTDRRIDFTTGDFRPAAGGAFEQCDPLENQIAFSLNVEKGTFEGDPQMGRRFSDLRRALDTDDTLRTIEQRCIEALQWLIDLGSLTKAVARAERFARGKCAFEVDCYPPGRPKFTVGPFFAAIGGG
jgi:phage gp46-like protein